MRLPLALLVSLALLALDADAQTARVPQTVGTADLELSAVATEGDHTVALLLSSSAVVARVGDGRAVDLEERVDIAIVPPGTALSGARVALLDGVAYFQWSEAAPGGVALPRFRTLELATGTLSPATAIDTGGDEVVTGLTWVATNGSGGAHLHLAYLRAATDEVVILPSHDGGASWLPPLVAQLPPFVSNTVQVGAASDNVHILWLEPLPSANQEQQLVYLRSGDGGQSLDSPTPVAIAPKATLYRFDADGDHLAIAWTEFEPAATIIFVNSTGVVTSRDGGATFESETFIGGTPPDPFVLIDNQDTARVAIADGGSRVVAAHVGYGDDGLPYIFARSSEDGGASWSSTIPFVTSTRVWALEVLVSPADRDRVALVWIERTPQRLLRAAVSHDGGVSYGAPFDLAPFPVATVQGAWNGLYENAVLRLPELDPTVNPPFGGAGEPFLGGFRPQTVQPQGLTTGATSISAALTGFDGGADLGFLVLSTQLGDLTLPDGRSLGLGASGAFVRSVALAGQGVLSGALDAAGDGTTGSATLPAPGFAPGTTLHAVGASFDLDTMTFVDLSDVVSTTL